MGTSILGIGQSALAAAQAGLATTGHNIANASTPGYNRQVVIQGASPGQDMGFGFVGKGTEVAGVKRIYNEFLNSQVIASQTTKSHLDAYYTQISRINNQFADEAAGISTVMQDFFKGLQNVASSLTPGPARAAALSSAETLAARFQSLDGQLNDARAGIANQINSSIGSINMYSQQIAKLNDAIEKAYVSGDGRAPNDLLDQRDLAIAELNKEIRTTVVKQGNSYSVMIGSGQPLVAGSKSFQLAPTVSRNDPSRAAIGYVGTSGVVEIPENTLTGGKLGGLLEFRAKTLDATQNALGRIAIGLAMSFNAQHALGQDQNGAIGGQFFKVGTPEIRGSALNSGDAEISASIVDANALTTSDYRLQRLGGNYILTRLSDQTVLHNGAGFPGTYDGVTFGNPSGAMADGDQFLIKPTVNGAGGFGVLVKDPAKLAASAPIRTTAPTTNIGDGSISAGTVNKPAPVNANLQQPVTITFTAGGTFDVTGIGTGNPVGVAYTPGADISYNGWTVQISGTPKPGDTFTIGPNTNGVGDNRNALLLAGLQTENTLGNGSVSFQGAYAQLVNQIGNKTYELEVTSVAEGKLLTQTIAAQQAESGVNLDEEAANLIRYQQAYQAAGKVMQTANQLFELLLTLGG